MKYILISIIILTGCATWTSADKILLASSIVATYADYHTTTNILDDGGYEMNPLFGKHPSRTELATYMVTSETLVIILAHYLPKYRSWILGGKTAINGACAIHNSRE